MKLRKWSSIKRDVFGLVAVGVTVFLFSCLKAGDGVGLKSDGSLFIPDPCIANPTGPTCPDPCIANPTGPGCPDPCIANPTGPTCPDLCILPNPPARCTIVVVPDPCHRDSGSTDFKPDSCLDRKLFADSVLPILQLKCPSCHSKPAGLGYTFTKLSLDAADAWASLVGVKAFEPTNYKKPELMLVRPGLPDSSFLWWKIFKKPPPVEPYTVMPAQPNNGPLTKEELAIIKKWIMGRN